MFAEITKRWAPSILTRSHQGVLGVAAAAALVSPFLVPLPSFFLPPIPMSTWGPWPSSHSLLYTFCYGLFRLWLKDLLSLLLFYGSYFSCHSLPSGPLSTHAAYFSFYTLCSLQKVWSFPLFLGILHLWILI